MVFTLALVGVYFVVLFCPDVIVVRSKIVVGLEQDGAGALCIVALVSLSVCVSCQRSCLYYP
jgi:hypothetical protein